MTLTAEERQRIVAMIEERSRATGIASLLPGPGTMVASSGRFCMGAWRDQGTMQVGVIVVRLDLLDALRAATGVDLQQVKGSYFLGDVR